MALRACLAALCATVKPSLCTRTVATTWQRRRYALTRTLGTLSGGNQGGECISHRFDATDRLRRQLFYRSHQRGWLELDILVGDYATQNIASMDDTALALFAKVLDEETPDLFQWLTGKTVDPQWGGRHVDVPSRMTSNAVFVDLVAFVKQRRSQRIVDRVV